MRQFRIYILAACGCMMVLLLENSYSQIRLPRLVSDGMVLQRDAKDKIWGWAASNERITVRFIDTTYEVVADSSGRWDVLLAPAHAGGPYEMVLRASNAITLHDIMVGEVWVCSGQSNMELPVKRVSPIYGKEIANSANEYIRQFYVPQKYDFNGPKDDVESGSWKSATPQSVLEFSAVAYFFGRELFEIYRVPIGLINTSLGGSPAESWMSEQALKAFPKYHEEAERFKDGTLIRKIEEGDNKRIRAWYETLAEKDDGYKDQAGSWYRPNLNTSDWGSMSIPDYWANTSLGFVNGVVWFRREFDVPPSMIGKPAKLNLGRIVDADSTFINGIFVGTVSYQYPPRRYDISPNVLRDGKNTIVVRIISNAGKGGFVSEKPYEIVQDNNTIDLKGEWKYRLGATMEPLTSQTFIRWKPEGLYNAMIAPLMNYRIKGAIWYQGEANAGRPMEYRNLFSALIKDWRQGWQQGDFPFLYVQLPNFMKPSNEPSESNWALLREAQLQTLAVPNTAMAVTIDIGEWNDIHPLDKKDVGIRLALAAQKLAYGNATVVYSGPVYQLMSVDGNRISLSFNSVARDLMIKGGGDLKCFAIAGTDRKFVWAHATIEGDKVIVSSDQVSNPVAVRYAWADNPEGAKLYNKDGLPASPFRTDDWPAK